MVMQHAQCPADDGIAVRPVPRRRFGFGAGEPGAQRGDQQQVEQAVEHRLLAGLVALHLGAERVDER